MKHSIDVDKYMHYRKMVKRCLFCEECKKNKGCWGDVEYYCKLKARVIGFQIAAKFCNYYKPCVGNENICDAPPPLQDHRTKNDICGG